MNNEKRKFIDGKLIRSLIVIAGIVLGQAVLYGPSLIGQKILLPLDLLTLPGIYIPPPPETAKIVPHDTVLTDLVFQLEPARQFALSEIHQGRFPTWAPYEYGGVPFVWPKYSLFLLLECCTWSPVILAWAQLFEALVGGIGMFFFCRKSLNVGFLAGNRLCLVLPFDGLFCSVARLFDGFAGLLASVAFPVSGQNGSRRKFHGANRFKYCNVFGPDQRAN